MGKCFSNLAKFNKEHYGTTRCLYTATTKKVAPSKPTFSTPLPETGMRHVLEAYSEALRDMRECPEWY